MTTKKNNGNKSGKSNKQSTAKKSGISPEEKRIREYTTQKYRKANQSFHLKLKHVLGGVSLLSLLAAFEVFSIPAGNGIIDVFNLTKIGAGAVWIGVAGFSGFAALVLHKEGEMKI